MEDQTYIYDVAFSFLFQDEETALNLFELLKDRLSCFIYTEEQKKLAGTDGEVSFSNVFIKETRLVVILYREEWGKTTWTRIEESAIRSRGHESGFDFALLIPLDHHSTTPDWFPKYRLWVGLEKWGIEACAGVIEARASELGTEIKDITVADKVASVAKELKQRQNVKRRLETEGRQLGLQEFKNVLTCINKHSDEIKQKAADWHFYIRPNKYNGVDVMSYEHSLTFQWYDNRFDPYMVIAFFKGGFMADGYADPMYPPTKLDFNRYFFNIDKFNQNGWSLQDHPEDFHTTQKLVDFWIERLLKYAMQSRLKK